MKDKTVAAILAFLFGVFGVHRFYLGQTLYGVLSLIFFWTGIPAIIGFIDAILFLAMDTDKFDYQYNWKRIDPNYRNLDTDFDRRKYAERRRRYDRTNRVRERQFDRSYQEEPKRQQPPKIKVKKPSKKVPLRNPYRDSGIQKFKDYDFEGAIDDFLKALELNDKDVPVHFNLACAYSITENKDAAFHHLEKAVANGFKDIKRINEHDSLAFLRIQPEFTNFAKNGYQMAKKVENSEKNTKESSNLLEQLRKLGELRDKGLLTDEEFTKQKQKLLG